MKNFLKACMTGILPKSIFTGSPVLVADMTWSCIQVMNDMQGLPTVSSSFLSPVSAVNPVERHMPSSYLPSFPGRLSRSVSWKAIKWISSWQTISILTNRSFSGSKWILKTGTKPGCFLFISLLTMTWYSMPTGPFDQISCRSGKVPIGFSQFQHRMIIIFPSFLIFLNHI